MSQEPILSPGTIPRISYAPHHEDILLDRLFGDHVGTFLDVGAGSPDRDNPTYFFYRRGWRGVNLEPVPRRHAQLQAARPGDLNLPLAAWDTNGEIPLFEADDGRSTLSRTIAEQYGAQGAAVRERRVPVRTIGSLAEELRLDPPDFLVIDAGGAGGPVLRGIPLEYWRPRVIVVESDWPQAVLPAQHGWEPILRAHGYLFAASNGINRFYLRDDHRALRPKLELPVSALDRFRRSDLVALEERLHALEQASSRWRIDQAHWSDRLAHSEHRRDETERRYADALREQDDRARRRADLEDRLAAAERERDQWRRRYEALRQELIATQRALRPYRLIDQLGVVTLGYRWARRLKPGRLEAGKGDG
jgi:FkbM family methyltransferase